MRELMSDALVATGAAIVVFSAGLVLLILASAVPTNNPYIGVFTFMLMPVMVVVGGVIAFIGVFMAGRHPGKDRGARER